MKDLMPYFHEEHKKRDTEYPPLPPQSTSASTVSSWRCPISQNCSDGQVRKIYSSDKLLLDL